LWHNLVVAGALPNLTEDKEALKAMVAALLRERDHLEIENLPAGRTGSLQETLLIDRARISFRAQMISPSC
jgi:hypothetical protein